MFIKINLCVQFAISCLVHNEGTNEKRHDETNHTNFTSKLPPKSEVRKSKSTELKSAIATQQRFMSVFSKEFDATTEASFLKSWNIARFKNPNSDCESVKKYITDQPASPGRGPLSVIKGFSISVQPGAPASRMGFLCEQYRKVKLFLCTFKNLAHEIVIIIFS